MGRNLEIFNDLKICALVPRSRLFRCLNGDKLSAIYYLPTQGVESYRVNICKVFDIRKGIRDLFARPPTSNLHRRLN